MTLQNLMTREVYMVGMTDKQFNAYVRKLKMQLEKVIKVLTKELQKDLED